MRKHPARFFFTAIFFTAVFFAAPSAFGSSWDFSYQNLSQIRKARFSPYQVPIYQYFGLGFSDLPLNTSFETNFKGFADAHTGFNNFDLYQAALNIEPAKHFQITGGRFWTVNGFDAALLDGGRLAFTPSEGYIGFTIFAGVPRYLDAGDFLNNPNGLSVGMGLELLNVKDTSARFSARWAKVNASRTNWVENDTVYLGLAGSRQFSGAWSTPVIYGDVEADTAGKEVNVGTLGFNLYPHWRLAVTIEGNHFDVARSSAKQTIFGSMFTGAIHQGREEAQIKLAKNFNFTENFSYYRYKPIGLGGRNGYFAGAGLDYFWEKAKLSANAEYYYRRSFGGTVNGGFLGLENNYLKHLYAEAGLDISHYSKITNQKKTAVSLVGELGWAFNKLCRLALGGEFNRNNWYDREGRVTANLELGFGKGDYTPEKRSKKVNRKFHEVL